jgi:uracil DNA glycosylase
MGASSSDSFPLPHSLQNIFEEVTDLPAVSVSTG